jgi:16S rRNA processing protein RimM
LTLVTAGRVGRPHGLDGSFYVEEPQHELAMGTRLVLGDRELTVERRGGTDERPLVRLAGLDDPRAARGELLLVEAELGEREWLAADLEGSTVAGHGRVTRVLAGPSCSVLELSDGTLVPFVSDAIRSIEGGEILLHEDFLG